MNTPFDKFTKVVKGLQSSVLFLPEDGLNTAIYYCKLHYEDSETVEQNIDRISQIMEQDL